MYLNDSGKSVCCTSNSIYPSIYNSAFSKETEANKKKPNVFKKV